MDRASRLRLAYTEMLLREYHRRMVHAPAVVDRLQAACRSARHVQEQTLLGLLRAQAGCEYGRAHGFESLSSYAEYRQRVPVVDYEALRPAVERMLGGESDVLVRGPASYFSTTSGSTAAPKFIPGTQTTITAGCEAILTRNALLRRDHPRAFAGRPLVVAGSMTEGTTRGGATYGAMTGFGYHASQMGFPGPALPYEMFAVPDPDARYYTILRVALGVRDLSALVAYNPSTLLRLVEAADQSWDALIDDLANGTLSVAVPAELRAGLQPWLQADPQRAGELRDLRRDGPRAWWPGLALLMCWKGGACGFYLADLAARVGRLPVRELGLLASEASVSVAVDDGCGGVLLPQAGFFEFVPEGAGPEAAQAAWQLDAGARYRLLVTTGGGLYRYDLGDVVRVLGHAGELPRLEFLQRAGRVYSFTGEKLTESQVTLAVRAAASAGGLHVAGFTAVPTWGRPPHYEVFFEPAGEPAAAAGTLAASIDDELCGLNREYDSKRKSGRLGAVVATRVAAGTFERLRRRRAGHDAQYKEVHLATDPAARQALAALDEVA